MAHDERSIPDAVCEQRGALVKGALKFNYQGVQFKNAKTSKQIVLAPNQWKNVEWTRLGNGWGIKVQLNDGKVHRFGLFKDTDYDNIAEFFKRNYTVSLDKQPPFVKGWNWGTPKFDGGSVKFMYDGESGFEMPLNYVSNCSTNKNEVVMEFHPNDDVGCSLMEMRFHIPNPPEGYSGVDPVEEFHRRVTDRAGIIEVTGEALLHFKEINFQTPRGRYDIKVFPTFMQLHGKTFDYKVPADSILRLFILPHYDRRHMYFVINVDPPVTQGKTRYNFLTLLLDANEESVEIDLGLTDEDLNERFEGRLTRNLNGKKYELIGKVIKGAYNKKIVAPRTDGYKSKNHSHGIQCSFKAVSGILFPLERGLVYLHKPTMYIRYDEIASIDFQRGGGSMRSFDITIEKRDGSQVNFNNVEKDEFTNLSEYFVGKGLRIKRLDQPQKQTLVQVAEQFDSDAEDDAYLHRVKEEGRVRHEADDEDSEADEDFKPPSDDDDDVAEEFDSEASESSGGEEGEDGEKLKRREKRREEKQKRREKDKRKPRTKDEDGGGGAAAKKSKSKPNKDPNAPKKPQTAYFLWMNANREQLKKENPTASVTELAKVSGEKWKLLTAGDKEKWEKQYAAQRAEYDIKMKDYKASGGGATANDAGAPSSKAARPPSQQPASSSSKYKSAEYVESSGESSAEDDSKKKKSNGGSSGGPSKKPETTPPKAGGDRRKRASDASLPSDHEEAEASASESDTDTDDSA